MYAEIIAPALGALLANIEIEPISIWQLIRLLGGLCSPAFDVCELHCGYFYLPVQRIPSRIPALLLDFTEVLWMFLEERDLKTLITQGFYGCQWISLEGEMAPGPNQN
jgi:hypothetical protein